ncbi:MAG: serine hydrolase, partial [Bacteroidota bacterium]
TLFASLFFISLVNFCFGQLNVDSLLKRPMADLETIGLDEAGFDQDTLQKMWDRLAEETVYDLRSIIVIKEGKLAMEEYSNSFWRDNINDIRSATKSITAILMGIAIDKGYVKGVEEKVFDFFPEYTADLTLTKAHKDIRIKHLLMMSSGLEADTDDLNTLGNSVRWVAKDNWLSYILALPMDYESGSKWVYTDVSPVLCAAIIKKQTGIGLEAFAKKHLFEPLGIQEYYWHKNTKGITSAMGNLYITGLDFAKIGAMVLDEGKWQNQQILSKVFIDQMLSDQLLLPQFDPFPASYGYFWYRAELDVRGEKVRVHYATGNGGNKLFLVPAEDLVVAVQSSAYGQGYGHGRSNFILRSILRSVMD